MAVVRFDFHLKPALRTVSLDPEELHEVIVRSGQVFPIVLDDEGTQCAASLRETQWVALREGYEVQIGRLLDSISRFQTSGIPARRRNSRLG